MEGGMKPTPKIVQLAPGKRLDLNPVAPRGERIRITPTEAPEAVSSIRRTLEQAAGRLVADVEIMPGLSGREKADRATRELMRLVRLIEDRVDLLPRPLERPVFWMIERFARRAIQRAFDALNRFGIVNREAA